MSKFTQFFRSHCKKSRVEKNSPHSDFWNSKNLPVFLGVLIVILAVGYLVQINRSSTKSFTVHALVQKQQALIEQRRSLELQQAELSALTNLENSTVISGMVASADPEYLVSSTADVARK